MLSRHHGSASGRGWRWLGADREWGMRTIKRTNSRF